MRLVAATAWVFLIACGSANRRAPANTPDAGDTPEVGAVDQVGAFDAGDDAAPDAGDDAAPAKPTNIIDDMEREDMAKDFVSPAGVLASWHAVANYAIGQQPLPGDAAIIQRLNWARGDSLRGARLLAPTLEDGADLFIDFHPATTGGPDSEHVDFSRFAGIAFWAHSGADTYDFIVAIKDDQLSGGNEEFWHAELESAMPWFSAVRTLSPEWARYEIRFDQFQQGLFPSSGRTPHPNAIRSIHFIASPHVPFELWIDDLVLIP